MIAPCEFALISTLTCFLSPWFELWWSLTWHKVISHTSTVHVHMSFRNSSDSRKRGAGECFESTLDAVAWWCVLFLPCPSRLGFSSPLLLVCLFLPEPSSSKHTKDPRPCCLWQHSPGLCQRGQTGAHLFWSSFLDWCCNAHQNYRGSSDGELLIPGSWGSGRNCMWYLQIMLPDLCNKCSELLRAIDHFSVFSCHQANVRQLPQKTRCKDEWVIMNSNICSWKTCRKSFGGVWFCFLVGLQNVQLVLPCQFER